MYCAHAFKDRLVINSRNKVRDCISQSLLVLLVRPTIASRKQRLPVVGTRVCLSSIPGHGRVTGPGCQKPSSMTSLYRVSRLACKWRTAEPSHRLRCSGFRWLGILAPSKKSKAERIAVLYQAIDPPIINGVRKPMKTGGMFSQSRVNASNSL